MYYHLGSIYNSLRIFNFVKRGYCNAGVSAVCLSVCVFVGREWGEHPLGTGTRRFI